jgi:hypothetical protein
MKNKLVGEILISAVFVILLFSFIDPLDILMPEKMHPFMVAMLLLLLIVFVGFLWKEIPGDEREQFHKYIASRFAYLAVIATLVIGVIVQSLYHKIDPWLIIAVCIIILAKIIGLIYGYFKH